MRRSRRKQQTEPVITKSVPIAAARIVNPQVLRTLRYAWQTCLGVTLIVAGRSLAVGLMYNNWFKVSDLVLCGASLVLFVLCFYTASVAKELLHAHEQSIRSREAES